MEQLHLMSLTELLQNSDVVNIALSSFNKHGKLIYSIDRSPYLKKQLIEEGIWLAHKHYKDNLKSSFLTYVYLRVRFVCLTFIRDHARRHKNTVHLSTITRDNDKLDISCYRNNDIEIIDILDSLKPVERDLVTKVYIENVSIQDIAKQKNVKELTILTQLNKIIKQLKMSINS